MKTSKKPLSILLSILMVVGLFTIIPNEASAAIAPPYYIDENGIYQDISSNSSLYSSFFSSSISSCSASNSALSFSQRAIAS